MRYVFWGLTTLFAVICATFAVSNRTPVGLTFWPLPFALEVPVYLIVIVVFVVAYLFGRLAGWVASLAVKRERNRQRKRIEALEAELGRMKGDEAAGSRGLGRSLVA